jgi:transcriptional regulator with XRE-family HTH domain
MEKLSVTLKQLLNEANISEAELARRTGIAQPMVNRLATGKNKNPKLETLKPITKYFSITFSQLLGEDPLPNTYQQHAANAGHEVPLLHWETKRLQGRDAIQLVLSTKSVASNAFALLVDNHAFTPRFPKHTLLIFDPTTPYQNKDFVAFDSQGKVKLGQLLDSAQGLTISVLNPSATEEEPLLIEQHEILGTLVQTQYDHQK